jgi:hypothetical protein
MGEKKCPLQTNGGPGRGVKAVDGFHALLNWQNHTFAHINQIGLLNIPEESFLSTFQKEMEQMRQQIVALGAALHGKK